MKTIFFLLLLSAALLAGDLPRVQPDKILFPQMQPITSYHSLGFSNMFTCPVGHIAGGNPAALSAFNAPAIGMSFNHHPTEIKLFGDITLGWNKPYLPSSAAFIYPISDFRIGLGYHLKYAHFLDSGKMEIRTVEKPEGTGEFFSATDETAIYDFSTLFAYTKNGLLMGGDQLSIGGQLSLDYVYTHAKIFKVEGKVNTTGLGWKVGALYWFNQKIGLSLFYENETDVEGEFKMKGNLLEFHDVESGEEFAAEPIKMRYRLPGVLAFGLVGNPLDNLSISVTATSVFWNALNKAYKDNLDISTNAVYSLFSFLDISFGVYQTNRMRKEDYYNYQYNATYLSAGARMRLYNFSLHLVVSDSHLYSAERREQTRINAGLDYEFK